uniref:Polyketide synthase n=1 Tax=Peronospora matthiolae TaxID=2874970 RepID=A0AAV1V4N5_9STRA
MTRLTRERDGLAIAVAAAQEGGAAGNSREDRRVWRNMELCRESLSRDLSFQSPVAACHKNILLTTPGLQICAIGQHMERLPPTAQLLSCGSHFVVVGVGTATVQSQPASLSSTTITDESRVV